MRRLACLVLLLAALPVSAAPADMQSALGWLIGTWDTDEVRHAEGGVQATGTAVFTWAMGDQFLREEYTSADYRGEGFIRWDPATGDYATWWFGSDGSVEKAESTWDGGPERVLYSVDSRDDRPLLQRETYTQVSDREYRYLYEESSGDGFHPVWELTARKR